MNAKNTPFNKTNLPASVVDPRKAKVDNAIDQRHQTGGGHEIRRGQTWRHPAGDYTVLVLAYVDKWAMVRRRNAVPFCVSARELSTVYRLTTIQRRAK